MITERWAEVKRLFHALLDRSPEERAALLAEAGRTDPALRQEVESLLAEHDAADGFLSGSPLSLLDEEANREGQHVGPYRLIRQIGRGGVGAVYLAERDEAPGTPVAVKLLHRGMDTDFILRRFRAERQILGKLDHPHIARLIDGGSTADGVPYFVMEYVDGSPIGDYCRTRATSVAERLRLFQAVCGAVQYAHEHHVVHRDIKPANIMVAADGSPKLLDFGIAKLLGTKPDGTTIDRTATGLRMMTPEYASPEQLRGEPVGPLSDVYALGVVLFELLTGRRPVAQPEPERPSAIPGSNAIAGDLDKVVLTALHKAPERRYASARALSDDIQRHLEGRAVTARADTATDRLQRFLRRRPRAVAAAIVGAATASGAALVWLALAGRAPEASPSARILLAVRPLEDLSGDPEQEFLSDGLTEELITRLGHMHPARLAVIARTSSMTYKHTSKSVAEMGRELGVAYVLEGSLRRGERLRVSVRLVRVADQTQLWAESYDRALSDVLSLQGEVAQRIADAIRLQLAPGETARLAASRPVDPQAHVAYLKARYFWNRRTDDALRKSRELFEEALARDPAYAPAWGGLAETYVVLMGRSVLSPAESCAKGEAAARKALALDESLAEAHAALAALKLCTWDWPGERAEFRRALELNPSDATARAWYAEHLMNVGKTEEALAEIRRAVEVDPLSLPVNAIEGWLFYRGRRFDEARARLGSVLDLDPDFATARWGLGATLLEQGHFPDAVRELERAVTLSGGNARVKATLADAYARSGRRREAEEVLRELETHARQHHVSALSFAIVYTALGRKEQAIDALQKGCRAHDLSSTTAIEPPLDPLRGLPGLDEVLRCMGLTRS